MAQHWSWRGARERVQRPRTAAAARHCAVLPTRLWRVLIIIIVLPGLLLPGAAAAQPSDDGGGAAQAASVERDRDRDRRPQPQAVWLQLTAFTDAPVVGASITVQQPEGRVLFEQHAATNDRGAFPAPVRGLPSSFRVIVSEGTINGSPFDGRLSADFQSFDPARQIAAVNPVTTLVSRVLDRRPNLGLAGAEARVRRFLELPADSDLGLALRESASYHSPFFGEATFMAEARQHGGFNAFEEFLVRELVARPTAIHPFPPTALLRGSEFSFSTELAKGATSYLAGKGVGWALVQSGLVTPGATKDDITQLQDALAGLQSSVTDLIRQQDALNRLLQSEITKSQYQQSAQTALDIASQVNTVATRINNFAQICPPLPEGAVAKPPSAYCVSEKQAITDNLNSVDIYGAYDRLSTVYVLDNPLAHTLGVLHLYSLWLGQGRPFFRTADSTSMQQLFDYWDAVQIQAANLRVELWHLQGAQDDPSARKLLTDFLGDATATPPTQGTVQRTHDEELKLLFPSVPEGTVINTKDRTMWPLAWPKAVSCQTSDWPGYGDPHLPDSYLGYSDWFRPSKDQWQNAVAAAPAGTNWMDWLISQTAASATESPLSPGFFNFTGVCHVGAWTFTLSTGQPSQVVCNDCSYWAIHPDLSIFAAEQRGRARNVIVPLRQLWPGEQYYFYQ